MISELDKLFRIFKLLMDKNDELVVNNCVTRVVVIVHGYARDIIVRNIKYFPKVRCMVMSRYHFSDFILILFQDGQKSALDLLVVLNFEIVEKMYSWRDVQENCEFTIVDI